MQIYFIILCFLLRFNAISSSILRKHISEESSKEISIVNQTSNFQNVINSIDYYKSAENLREYKNRGRIVKRNTEQMVKNDENIVNNYTITLKEVINNTDIVARSNNDTTKSNSIEASIDNETNKNITRIETQNESVNDGNTNSSYANVVDRETEPKNIVSISLMSQETNDSKSFNNDKSHTIEEDTRDGMTNKTDGILNNTRRSKNPSYSSDSVDDKQTNNQTNGSKHINNVFMIINSGNIENKMPVLNKDTENSRKMPDNVQKDDLNSLNVVINAAIDNFISRIPEILDDFNKGEGNDSKKLFLILNSGNIIRERNDFKTPRTHETLKNKDNISYKDEYTKQNDSNRSTDDIKYETQVPDVSTRVKRDLRPSITSIPNSEDNNMEYSDSYTDQIDFNSKSNEVIDALQNEMQYITIDEVLKDLAVQKVLTERLELFKPINASSLIMELGEFQLLSYPIPVKIKIHLLIGQ